MLHTTTAPVTAVVIPYVFLPPKNGGHQAGYSLCSALGKKIPTVCISSFGNAHVGYNFQLEFAFGKGMFKYFSPLAAWRCFRIMKASRVRHCIAQQPFIVPLLLPLLALSGISMLVYAHNIEYRRFRSMNKWWWCIVWLVEFVVYRLARQVLFISPEERIAAIAEFGLDPVKCIDVPYGIDRKTPPLASEQQAARKEIAAAHGFPEAEHWLLFFGPQNYEPNLDAVLFIARHLAPLLKAQTKNPYRILICGGSLPPVYQNLEAYRQYHVDYLGFVEDIDRYVLASDLVLNPILKGAGVKTKVLEAIALGKTVVSTESGAFGIQKDVCGQQLVVVADHDTPAFANAVLNHLDVDKERTPVEFYDYYYRDNVVNRLLPILQKT
ncbi:MAG: glycosyltransferase family 4 protein [Saprospiraceae bacterium]|nr:glycosyltransferase family 4 protein [Saprospiraceae bacterium]